MTPASDLRGSDSRGYMDRSESPLEHERYVNEITRNDVEFIATERQEAPLQATAIDVYAIQQGIEQAHAYATRASEREIVERQKFLARRLGDVGMHIQMNRDYVKADFDTAA